MRSFVFFTAGTGPISRMIQRITVPATYRNGAHAPSHTGLAFHLGEDRWQLAEAHAVTGGFTGWHPLVDLLAWVNHKQRRTAWMIELPLDTAQAAALHAKTEAHIGFHPYDSKQILQLWARARLSIPFPRNPAKAVCSEMVSRLISAHLNIPELLDLRGHDYVTPWHCHQALQTGLPDWGEIHPIPGNFIQWLQTLEADHAPR